MPIKEDFYPKRPTRASRLAALGPIATLIGLVVAVALGHEQEVGIVMAMAMVWDTGSWAPIVGLVGIVVAHGKTIVRRDSLVERDMLTARAGLGFLAAWVLLFVAGIVTLFHERLALAVWAALFFGLLAAVELFRILVVPPAEAGPNWWKWDATGA